MTSCWTLKYRRFARSSRNTSVSAGDSEPWPRCSRRMLFALESLPAASARGLGKVLLALDAAVELLEQQRQPEPQNEADQGPEADVAERASGRPAWSSASRAQRSRLCQSGVLSLWVPSRKATNASASPFAICAERAAEDVVAVIWMMSDSPCCSELTAASISPALIPGRRSAARTEMAGRDKSCRFVSTARCGCSSRPQQQGTRRRVFLSACTVSATAASVAATRQRATTQILRRITCAILERSDSSVWRADGKYRSFGSLRDCGSLQVGDCSTDPGVISIVWPCVGWASYRRFAPQLAPLRPSTRIRLPLCHRACRRRPGRLQA